jgi:hypothetical protein
VAATLLAAALLVGALVTAIAQPAGASGSPGPAVPPVVPPGVVLAGVASLRWSDVTEADAPTLFRLAGDAGAGSVTVRSVRARTCVVDGWLSISAGRRAADPVADHCRTVPDPVPLSGDAVRAGEWDLLRDYQATQKYDAHPGVLGGALAAAGACATAVGPGAALALAEQDGTVPRYRDSVAGLSTGELAACPVTVVDLGAVAHLGEPADRAADVRAVDTEVARLLDLLPPGYALLVAGISDAGPTGPRTPEQPSVLPPPALRLGLAAGPPYDGRWLTAGSTRWTGLVQLLDLTPTLTEVAGVPRTDPTVTDLVGQPWRGGARHPASAAETVDQLVSADDAAQVFRRQSGAFYQALGLIQAVVYLGVLLWIRLGVSPDRRRALLRVVQAVAMAAAAVPVASFLTNLTRWWRFDSPPTVLWPSLVLISAVIAGIAAAGPWRSRAYGPPAVIAAITVTVLAVDVLSGSNLQHSSLLGLTPLTAGRFYGLGNIPFGIFAAALIFLCGALAGWAHDRGASSRTQAAVVLAVGLAGVAVIGYPGAGADFGGVLAGIPGVLVLAVGVAGSALTLRRLLAIGLLSVLAVSAVAVLDWLRPAEDRSHFGDFVAQLVDGTAWPIVRRKVGASLGTLDNPYSWLVPVAYAIIWRLVLWRSRPQPAAVEALCRLWPAFPPTVLAGLVTGFVGFAVNDSGMTVPAMLLTVGIPLGVAAITKAGREVPAAAPEPAAARR